MAKSGQRRAFEDEAIQPAVPQEELKVTDRKAMDYTANLDAEYNRAGAFFNPDFFNSLAQISSDIHGVRRTKDYYDAQLDRLITKSNYDTVEKDYERELKNTADLNVFDSKMQDMQRREEARLKAKNSGQNYAEVVPQLQMKLEDDIDKWGTTSPYIADQLNKYKEETYPGVMRDAIRDDGDMNQAKALLRLQAYGDIISNDIAQGKVSLDDAIAGASNMIAPLANVAKVKAELAMNTFYNQVMRNQIAGIEGDVKNGNLTVEEGKQKILGLLTDYRTKTIEGIRERHTDFTEDPQGKEVVTKEKYTVWLDQDSLDAAQKLMGDLDKYKPKVSTISVAEDFLKMIGYNTWKDGKNFGLTPYLRGTSLSKFRDDWWRTHSVLVQARNAGDPNADAKLYEVDTGYFKGRQILLTANLLNRQTNRSKLREAQQFLLRDLNKGNVGQFRNVPSYLVFDDGTNIINLGFPSDADFEDYMRRSPGQDADTMRYNYYKDQFDILTEMLKQDVTSDKVAMMDPQYSEYTNKVDQMLTPQNLVSTDAQGHVVMNLDGVNQLAQLMQQGEQIGRKANNGAYIGAPTSAILESFAKKVNAMTPEIKAVAIRAYAESCVRAGNYGGIVDSMMNSNISGDAKAVVQQASVYALLAPDPMLKAYMGNVSDLQISKTFTNLTVGGAQNELKNHGFASFSAALEQKMAQAKVPAEFKPAIRSAASQLYLAVLEQHMGDKNYSGYKVSGALLDRLISANFKDGAYIHSSALKGVNVDNLVNNANTARNQVHTGLKKLGVKPGDIDTRINYRAKAEEIYVAGQPLYMTGSGSSLTGSGLQPFMLYFDNKPATMPQGKYDSAHTALLTGATSLAAASDIRSSSKMQDLLAKKGKGMNVNTLEDLTCQMLNTAADPEVQKAWYEYFNSNFTNTQLVNAPDGAKDVLVDIYGQGFWENIKTGGGKGAMTRDQLSHYIDFLYTRMQNGKSARLDMAVTTYVQGKGVPLAEIRENMSKSSRPWYISALKDDHSKYTPSGAISQHYYKKSMDMGLRGGFAQATFTTRNGVNIKREYLDSALKDVILPGVKAGYITSVGYNFYNLRHDPAFAKYRNMKNKQGQPLFIEYTGDHPNHFHLNLSEPWVDGKPTPKAPASNQFITDTTHLIKTNVAGIYNYQDARACARQGIHYTATSDDAKRMGKPLHVLNSNAAYRAQTYANKFASYRNVLRSTNFTVAAMAGCTFEITDTNMALIPTSVKIPMYKALTGDQLIKILGAVPYNALHFRYSPDTTNMKKVSNAIDRWVKDGK